MASKFTATGAPATPQTQLDPRPGPLVDPAGELSPDEVERYSRHLIIPEIGAIGQRRLKNAKVLVIGAGGLGSPALLYLAAAGVGTLGIVDDDDVDLSNLQRQIIHGVADVGRPKIESARDAIAALNPLVTSGSTMSASTLPTRWSSLPATISSSTAPTTLPPATWSTTPLPSSASPMSGDRSSASTARSASFGSSSGPPTGTSTRRRRRPDPCRPAAKAACSACCAPPSVR